MYVWLLMIIVLSIIEAATVNLTTIWFIASAIVSLIISFFSDNILLQTGTFVIVGLFLLLTTRKFLVECLSHKNEKTNIDRIVGMKGIVTEDILKNKIGEVKVDGKVWSAYADEEIRKEEEVIVLEIQSTKLKVKKGSE